MSLAGLLKFQNPPAITERERERIRQLKRHRVLKFSLQLLLEDDWTCSNVERGYAHTVGDDVTSFSQRKNTVCEAVPWAVWPLTLELWWIMPESKPRPISKVNFGSNSLNKSNCWFMISMGIRKAHWFTYNERMPIESNVNARASNEEATPWKNQKKAGWAKVCQS